MHQSDRAGLLYALAGFCILSIGDAIIKGMAGEWPVPAMATTRYIVGVGLLAVLVLRQHGTAGLALPRDGLQWLRGVAISLSAVGMFLAVWILPLAEATTIAFTQPVITALLAMVFLKERSHRETWIATGAAFVGVFIVLRPNFDSAGWAVLLPLLSAASMAVVIIANRKTAGRASVLAMQYWMSVTALIFLAGVTLVGHLSGIENFQVTVPHWSIVARCAFIGLSATLAQYLIYMGTMRAGAGTVAPMTYGQLLMAVGLGWYFFGDAPDGVAMVGAGIIIAAGLFLWYAGRRRDRARKAAG